MAGRRPNILILMADQLSAAALPAWGNPVARTPTLDALAGEGVVFRNFHCVSPLCAPARAVLMSGLLPSHSGVYDNAAHFAADIPTFAHYLRAAGYRTILAGKMHFCGPDQLHGFEERLTTDIYPADFGWTPDWSDPEARPDWYHTMSSVTAAGLCVRTNQIDYDEEVAFAAKRRIFDIARGNDDRPFCLVVSFTHPHDPFAITADYWDRFAHAAIDMPRVAAPVLPLDPHSARLRRVIGLAEREITAAETRCARHAYYGEIAYVDELMGGVRGALAASGMARETVTLALADHGEMLGERGLWYKMNFFEGASRVPLIVHAPGLFPARTVEGAASLLDVLPTLAAIAGDGREPRYAVPVDGRSLLAELSGREGGDLAVGEYLAEGAIAPIVMIRRGRWKFIHSPADPDLLFDLVADPDELVDRVASAAGVAAAFRAEVAARWDLVALDRAVRQSQRRRLLVAPALRQGRIRAWEFQPFVDAAEQYMRNHLKLDDLEAQSRFPRGSG